MSATPAPPAPPSDPELDDSPAARGWSRSAKVQVVLIVSIIAFWGAILGWTLVGDRGTPPDRMVDRSFPTAAEPRCAEALVAIDALGLPTEVGSPLERAEMVDDENRILDDLLDDLDDLPRPDGEEGDWIAAWLADWRVHVADRQAWSDDLRVGRDRYFVETARAGEQISKAIDNFADVNDMASCATPGDV